MNVTSSFKLQKNNLKTLQ